MNEGRVVNLHQARKRRDREREAAVAAENRIVFGMTRGERRRAEAEREKTERGLDSHKLDRPNGD